MTSRHRTHQIPGRAFLGEAARPIAIRSTVRTPGAASSASPPPPRPDDGPRVAGVIVQSPAPPGLADLLDEIDPTRDLDALGIVRIASPRHRPPVFAAGTFRSVS